jgi:putative membrane-bound dehydrogenase-like protein
MRRLAGLSVAWLALVLVGDTRADDAGPTVSVGAARVDITPGYPVRLHGYLGRTQESGGVAQRLWAKALVIGSDAEKPVTLVSVDNLGVGERLVDEVAEQLKQRTGMARERFTVACSHTHSAPCTSGVAPHIFGMKITDKEQAAIDRYTRELTDKIEQVSLDALKARRPGRLAWSEGRVAFAANRRTPGGPVDHSLPALRVIDPDGSLRAVVVNYACHCTTLDPKENTISGDWAGYAQSAIEADHPGAIAMTVIGCGADANPTRRLAPGAAADHGRAIADEVNRLLAGPWRELPGPPAAAFERCALPFDTLPTAAELERLVKAGGAPGYNASVQLDKLARGEPLQSRVNYSAQAWSFGDALVMVFLPGEVVVDYALRLKKELDPSRLWVTAYANDLPCYIASERILREGGYEGGGAMVYYARPTRLKPGVEQIIIDAVHRVVPDRFNAPKGRARAASDDESMPPPKPPAQALATIRTKPGLTVELVAAEPLVESPVAIDFGGDGKLWVCEMRDYPTGIDGRWKPGGVIKVLEDRDHDGRFETATPFLEGVAFPTGLMAWRKGVLVCAAPEIFYAEDTDGDGKADLRRVLFAGFATENYQARVNGLSYGLDNWVYGANGLIGGVIRGLATGREIKIGGRDFRINPDTGVMEPASGLTQQGRVRDDWGNQFGGNNSVLIQHYPLPDQYARRNPRAAAPSPAVQLARDADPSLLFPASRTLARYNHPESANRVTSACSPLIYRDALMGEQYAGNAFTCEPVHNLVQRLVLKPDGVTFAGHRAEDERASEFLAATDPWFRPVQVRTGPDGALWVVDMYRFVIEHPRWISPDRLATLDVRAGADRGRIYRVFPSDSRPRTMSRLENLTTVELARQLDSPNGTVRDLVQRLLVHRRDRTAVPVLAELARSSARPECRVQALGALDGLDSLDPTILKVALDDAHPGVRREAVRLSERWLDSDAALRRAVTELADDPAIVVRFQAALSLGECNDPEAGRALGRIAGRDGDDTWLRAAVLSSSKRHGAAVLEAVVGSSAKKAPPSALVEPLIATLSASGDRAAIARALAAIGGQDPGPKSTAPWRLGGIAALLDAGGEASLANSPAVRAMIDAARRMVEDRSARPADRAAALRLLGRVKEDLTADRAVIAARLDPGEPAEVQLASVHTLARLGDRPAAQALISRWSRLGPLARASTLDALLARSDYTEALLNALETKTIAASEIDASHRERVIGEGPKAVRARVARVFEGLAIGPRQAVLTAFASARTARGDPERGKAVFRKTCASCHKLAGEGQEVGPDLAALTDTSPDALMTAILDPNRDVDARYASYTAALKDGRILTGLIAAETASAITLKRQEGQVDVILRADLEELATSGRSLMPEGLENDLKPADLADVIAFLARGASRPKTIEGNHPQVIVQSGESPIRLPASAAEVFGPSLTFERELGNLGYWESEQDHAAWTFRVNKPATFTMSLEWACADESAGNELLLRVGGSTFVHVVAGTGAGTWANYRTIFVTEISLPAGTHRLDVRPAGRVRSALLDLRAVRLTPRSEAVYRATPREQ